MNVERAGDDWTNESVLQFAAGSDPITAATTAARRLLDAAVKHGLVAPPVDPFALAHMLGLAVRPHNDVTDASIVEDPESAGTERDTSSSPLVVLLPAPARLTIGYNPNRPRGRLRFSIAHEIAHALFPDVHQTIRRRTGTGAVAALAEDDEWELELLCNIIAAELLLPEEAVEGLLDIDTDIDFIMETRRRWDVSTEALLRRLARSSARGLTLVAASRRPDESTARLQVEYTESSPTSPAILHRGDLLPDDSPFGRCTAVGQTARGQLTIDGDTHLAQVVGIPGYPGRLYPRVLGLLERPEIAPDNREIEHVVGDLFDLDDGDGPVVIAHVVTDAARAWSRRGVAAALARRYPDAAHAFRWWAIASPENLTLGNVHTVDVHAGERPVTVASIVAQQGYGPGKMTRLHYDALHRGLVEVANIARDKGAELHVPRLGAGQAGGRWDLIERDLANTVAAASVKVIVHTAPSQPDAREA